MEVGVRMFYESGTNQLILLQDTDREGVSRNLNFRFQGISQHLN